MAIATYGGHFPQREVANFRESLDKFLQVATSPIMRIRMGIAKRKATKALRMLDSSSLTVLKALREQMETCVQNSCEKREDCMRMILAETRDMRRNLEWAEKVCARLCSKNPELKEADEILLGILTRWDNYFEDLLIRMDPRLAKEFEAAIEGIEDQEDIEDIKAALVGSKIASLEGTVPWTSVKRELSL